VFDAASHGSWLASCSTTIVTGTGDTGRRNVRLGLPCPCDGKLSCWYSPTPSLGTAVLGRSAGDGRPLLSCLQIVYEPPWGVGCCGLPACRKRLIGAA